MILEAVNHIRFSKKVSKLVSFLIQSGEFIYWYCDIIDYEYDEEKDAHTFIDLLVDVKVVDNKIEVLDLNELKEALDKGLIDNERFLRAINKLNRLFKMIENSESMEILVAYLIKTNS